MSSISAKQVRDFIPAGLLSAGRNVRILRCLIVPRHLGALSHTNRGAAPVPSGLH